MTDLPCTREELLRKNSWSRERVQRYTGTKIQGPLPRLISHAHISKIVLTILKALRKEDQHLSKYSSLQLFFFTGELMFLPVLLRGTLYCLMRWKAPWKTVSRWPNILKYDIFWKRMLREWSSQSILRLPSLAKLLFLMREA